MHLSKHPLNIAQDLIASLTGGCLFFDTMVKKRENHNKPQQITTILDALIQQ